MKSSLTRRGAAFALVLGVVAFAHEARAAGYALYEQGAAALGMAGAASASVNDASAMFFNPAALTRLDGTRVYVGGSLLTPSVSFAGTPGNRQDGSQSYPGGGVTEEMKRQWFELPTVYVTHRYPTHWAVGVGVNAPFGLGVDWKNPDQFTGRYVVTKARLSAVNTNLTAAYEINSQWSVAAGGDLLFSSVELHNRLQAPPPGGGGALIDIAKADLKGDRSSGYGWNAAVSFVPAPRWKFGAGYHSKIVVDEDGKADFTQIPTGNVPFDNAVAASLPPDQDLSTVLRFPATWNGGVAFLPAPAWTLEADAYYVEWKVFTDLPLDFKTTPSANRAIVENYDNTFQVRVGAEHRLPSFTYRFGYYFDQAAAPTESVSPILPDSDRHGATLGLGFTIGQTHPVHVDVYDLALFVKRRGTDGINRDFYDGEYKTFIQSAGLTAEWRF
jgi:long-chain fatty acid transport protein